MFPIRRSRPSGTTTADTLRGWNTVLDDVFAGFPALATGASRLVPATDVVENDDAWTLRLELPGVRADAVQLNVEKDTLSIRAEKKHESTTEGEQYHRVERSFGVFERRFSLSNAVNADAIEASMADGVLSILLPKQERAKSRTIEVK